MPARRDLPGKQYARDTVMSGQMKEGKDALRPGAA